MELIDHLKRMISPIISKVNSLVFRGVVEKVNDSKDLQILTLNIGGGNLVSKIERVQNYGFTSHPVKGAQTVILFPGGNKSSGLAIAVDDGNYRIELDEGEAALYSKFGNLIKMKSDGSIEISTLPGKDIKLNANVEISGMLNVSMDVKAGPAKVGLLSHVHPVTSAPGTTGPGVG